MIELRDRYPTLYRALKAMSSNKDTTFKQRIYGAMWAILILLLVIRYVDPINAFVRWFFVFVIVFIPPLIAEFTYHPVRMLFHRIFKRKRG